MELRPRVRRFFCDNTACAARTFDAQVDGLTVRYGRVTMLRRVLCAIAVTVAARVGVRLAARLGISVGREGSQLTYSWDFGDNTTSTDPNPTHTYASNVNPQAGLGIR